MGQSISLKTPPGQSGTDRDVTSILAPKKMRVKKEGANYINDLVMQMKKTHKQAMKVYGEGNEDRLTGDCETQHYSKFTWGNGDRTASVRIPMFTVRNGWKGHVEDPTRWKHGPIRSICIRSQHPRKLIREREGNR